MTKIERIKEAMTAYRDEWDLTHPPPTKGKVPAMDFIQFYLFLPVALLGPLVSSFRTGALLVETAAFQGDALLVSIEALLGTVFFELGAIAYQVIRLRRKFQEEGGMPKVGTSWIILGMIITIGAVTTSNFVEVLIAALEKANANTIPPFFTALLIGVFIGPGVAVCSVIAGEVIGRFVLEWQEANAKVVGAYREALAKHEKSFVGSWNSKTGGKAFLAAWLKKPTTESVQTDGSRSEYSKWPDRDWESRQAEIVRYVRENDPERKGVEVTEIWEAVWNGRTGSDSTKYKDITDLISSGILEYVNGGGARRVRLKVHGLEA